MNSLIKLALIAIFVVGQSCDSAKKATSNESSKAEETKVMNQKLISEGYSIGTITYKDNGECSYTILDEKTNSMFDPTNILDKRFDAFKNKSTKVYFKYRRLRRLNRCNNIQVIELEDLKKRSE